MKLDQDELDLIAEGVARRLLPALLAEISKHPATSGADTDRFWSVAEAAKYLGVSENTLLARVADGLIPCIKLGRRRLFDGAQLRESLAALAQTVSGETR